MADVMVVSIFMAYIGFSRLIETQLGQIGTRTPQVDVLVTNGTQLQVGFYFFAAFCLLGLIISTLAERYLRTPSRLSLPHNMIEHDSGDNIV